MFGCRPSGTFSYDLDVTNNVSLAWPRPFRQAESPDTLGCLGNQELVVCQGDGRINRGYVSLNVDNGSLVWSDKVLNHPSLPIMDVYGDIVGTDGRKLVMYEVDGTLVKPIVNEKNLSPVYSITFSDNNIFAIVSKKGLLVTVESNGVPHAFMDFRGSEERMNGTFIPIAPPVVNGHRIYMLTAFRPDNNKSELSMRRLYAVDIFNVLSGKLKVAWYYNFEKLSYSKYDIPIKHNVDDVSPPQILLNTDTETFYVNLPPLHYTENAIHLLYGFKDDLNSTVPTTLFKTPQSVSQLSMYESGIGRLETVKTKNHDGQWVSFQGKHKPRGAINENSDSINGSVLWAVSTDKSLILKLSPTDGSVLSHISLKDIFDMPATVTSRMMVAKSKSPPGEFLIFGIDVTPSNGAVSKTFKNLCKNHLTNPHLRYYVVSIQLTNLVVNWVIDTPKQYPVVGQIAGIKRGKDKTDLLIVTTNAQQGKANMKKLITVHVITMKRKVFRKQTANQEKIVTVDHRKA
uniref:Uncharacterized protein n=1 Tax=Magallana gigas TaxID=29159 RepID=K1QTC3_MAGGI